MDTQQENTLEQSLRMAADEPAHRPDFFTTLLNSTVYVLGTAGTGKGHVTLEAGSDISIANWHKADGSPVIPFFSSLQTLQASIESEESYVEIPARSLFEITLPLPKIRSTSRSRTRFSAAAKPWRRTKRGMHGSL
ncbi:SseB family protein [Pseudomonas sp. AK106]